MGMVEMEGIQEYRVREENLSPSGKVFFVEDEKGNNIADFSIVKGTDGDKGILYSRIPCTQLEKDIPCYTASLHSYVNERGIGTQLWMRGELSFYQEAQETYLRLIHDITDDGWTERRLPEMLEFLKSQGVPVTCVWEGYFLDRRKAWVLLFEKEE